MGHDKISKSANIKSLLKRLLIVEIVICYMVVLTIISHVRGPEKYQRYSAGPEWVASDFWCFDDTGSSNVLGDVLHLENAVSGHNVVFQADVNMTGIDGFHISFTIDCPSEYQGTHLAVDFYNEEAGYDEGSMEYMHTLSEGENKILCELFPQENAPDTALMRIFTSDPANYDLQGLQIYPMHRVEKVSAGMVFALFLTVAAAVTTGVTIWLGPCEKLKSKMQQQDTA